MTTDPETPKEYPVHDKMRSVAHLAEPAAHFLEWLAANGYRICVPLDAGEGAGYRWSGKTDAVLVAAWLGIDLAAMSAEKQAMLADREEPVVDLAAAHAHAVSPLNPVSPRPEGQVG